MIVQVRGASGAGKSTLIQRLLREHGGAVAEKRAFEQPEGKQVTAHLWRCDDDLCVLGRYSTLTGVSKGAGGGFVKGEVGQEIVEHYGRLHRHLVWESYWGATELPQEHWLSRARELGIVWATLDTPVEECLARIERRRLERGANVGAPLNPDAVREHHQAVQRLAREGAEAGIPVVTLNHQRAYNQLHDVLRLGGWRCRHYPPPAASSPPG